MNERALDADLELREEDAEKVPGGSQNKIGTGGGGTTGPVPGQPGSGTPLKAEELGPLTQI